MRAAYLDDCSLFIRAYIYHCVFPSAVMLDEQGHTRQLCHIKGSTRQHTIVILLHAKVCHMIEVSESW